MDSIHHASLRKHLRKSAPEPAASKSLLDRFMLVIAVIGPVATIPQAIQLFSTRDAEGLSFTTWATWTVLSGFWLWYGIKHNEPPIILANSIYLVLEGAIAVGILMYS